MHLKITPHTYVRITHNTNIYLKNLILLFRLKSFWKWMMGRDYSGTHLSSSFSVDNSPTIVKKTS